MQIINDKIYGDSCYYPVQSLGYLFLKVMVAGTLKRHLSDKLASFFLKFRRYLLGSTRTCAIIVSLTKPILVDETRSPPSLALVGGDSNF